MPIFYRVRPFVKGSLARTRRVEQNAIKNLAKMTPLLTRIERHSDIWRVHAFEILQKLRNALAGRLVRDNKGIREIFRELRRLATRRRRHIENEKIIFVNFPICKQIHRVCGRKFLNIKIADEMVDAHAETAFKWVKIHLAISHKNSWNSGFMKKPTISFEAIFYGFFKSRFDANRAKNRLFK